MTTTPSRNTNTSIATVLAVVGAAFVFTAIAALVSANWGSIPTAIRILILVLPVALLYISGTTKVVVEKASTISSIAIVTGHAAFPLVLGVILHQTEMFRSINGNFTAVISAISALWYICWQLQYKRSYSSPFVIVATITWIISLLSIFGAAAWFGYLLLSLLGLFFLVSSTAFDKTEENRFSQYSYMIAGALLVLVTSALGPWTLIGLRLHPELWTQLGFIAAGKVLLLSAIIVGNYWKLEKDVLFGRFRLIAETLAVIAAVVPSLIISLATTGTDSFISLLLSLIVIGIFGLIGTITKLEFYRKVILYFAAPLYVVITISRIFSAIDLNGPILILLVGILLFAIAIVIAVRANRHEEASVDTNGLLNWLNQSPEKSWFGLGETVDMPSSFSITSGNVVFSKHANDTNAASVGYFLLAIFVGIPVLLFILRSLSFLFNGDTTNYFY